MSVYSICLFLTLAWISVLISTSLWSLLQPPQPSGLCATFSVCPWASDIKGIWGAPHTTLYQTGIPLCSLDTPPEHFLLLTPLWHGASNRQWHFAPLDVPPQYHFEEWKWSCGHCLPRGLARYTGHLYCIQCVSIFQEILQYTKNT